MLATCYYTYSSSTPEVESPRFLEKKLGFGNNALGMVFARKPGMIKSHTDLCSTQKLLERGLILLEDITKIPGKKFSSWKNNRLLELDEAVLIAKCLGHFHGAWARY